MKKFLFSFLLLSPTLAFAHPINMEIICKIESNCDDNAKGSAGERGRYQISPIVLKHFNNLHMIGALKKSEFGPPTWADTDAGPFTKDDLKNPILNSMIANWYMNFIYERTWTQYDAIIGWNRGLGNWRKWREQGADWNQLPKTTQAYLKRYQELSGEKL